MLKSGAPLVPGLSSTLPLSLGAPRPCLGQDVTDFGGRPAAILVCPLFQNRDLTTRFQVKNTHGQETLPRPLRTGPSSCEEPRWPLAPIPPGGQGDGLQANPAGAAAEEDMHLLTRTPGQPCCVCAHADPNRPCTAPTSGQVCPGTQVPQPLHLLRVGAQRTRPPAGIQTAAQGARAGRRLGGRWPCCWWERDSTAAQPAGTTGVPAAYTWPMAVNLSCQSLRPIYSPLIDSPGVQMESDRESSQMAHVHEHRWAWPGHVCTHGDGEAWLPPQHQAPCPPGRRHGKVGHARPTLGIPRFSCLCLSTCWWL